MSSTPDTRPVDQETKDPLTSITLHASPERRLIRTAPSFRHVLFRLAVRQEEGSAARDRAPLSLALVLDRSGSMQGEKLHTAKRAALAVLDRLDPRDRVAAVIFDEHIDVLQPPASVTPALREALRAALHAVEARGSTALHEGWLTGCHAIAGETRQDGQAAVARCFLLTDGQANHGLTDPEAIASQAADLLETAGIGTSTFGIGDYNEALLGPLANAGGGQFHHLRTSAEIANTFLGELGDLLTVAAQRVRLQLTVSPGVSIDVVSDYRQGRAQSEEVTHTLLIGDLLAGEDRPVVVRFGFPGAHGQPTQTVRARVIWQEDGVERVTPWQDLHFSYAGHAECDAELARRDPEVMRLVGQHHAYRAQIQASDRYGAGDRQGGRDLLRQVARRIGEYAGDDPVLREAMQMLHGAEHQLQDKETRYRSQRLQKGYRDHRQDPPNLS